MFPCFQSLTFDRDVALALDQVPARRSEFGSAAHRSYGHFRPPTTIRTVVALIFKETRSCYRNLVHEAPLFVRGKQIVREVEDLFLRVRRAALCALFVVVESLIPARG